MRSLQVLALPGEAKIVDMPRRPIPNIPRGPRRPRSFPARLLACPRISPEWELAALQALIKPQLKGAILHRTAEQKWTRSMQRALHHTSDALLQSLGTQIDIHLPAAGDYHFLADITDAPPDDARAWAIAISKALPDLWLVLGRLFLKNGQFYRRRYGYKLSLVPAKNIHLPRALRAAIKDCV